MNQEPAATEDPATTEKGISSLEIEVAAWTQRRKVLRWTRRAGYGVGAVILAWTLWRFLHPTDGMPGSVLILATAAYTLFGLLMLIPYSQLRADKTFWRAFTVFALAGGLFVFLQVVDVIFLYMEAARGGERLGVPGFRGSLIFFGLMQIPVVLFVRKPEMLD